MQRMDTKQESVLRDIILNTRKPVVLKNLRPNWKCFDCPLEEWCKKFDTHLPLEESVEFERMPTKFGHCPQWERYRAKAEMTFKAFLDTHSKDSENWYAFNYSRVERIPLDCRHDVDFSCFGFSQATKDASFWLSSKCANTPCHYDTYGCNIVVQVYGRKRWLLFPPDTQLTPTRVPYEESSVYCSENFFSPKTTKPFEAVRQNAFECILGDGDVLIVPRNWWHYVESLETSLSVNAWVPLEIDLEAQVQECIVKYIVEKGICSESDEERRYILNPNQLELITPTEDLFQILRFLLRNYAHETGETMQTKLEKKTYPYEYLSEAEVSDLISRSKYDVRVLEPLHPTEFDSLMEAKTTRFIDMKLPDTLNIDPIHEALLNAICHPNVIRVVKDQFLKTYSSSD